jgi:hypothetical protein
LEKLKCSTKELKESKRLK